MNVLVEPYFKSKFFVFVLHPKIRSSALMVLVFLFVGALVRALILSESMLEVIGSGVWLLSVAYVITPVWNRFVVYPMVKKFVKKDRLVFLVFFEGFFLFGALWLMLSLVIWG